MKKLLVILGVLLGLVVIGGIVLTFTLGPIIAKSVNTFGPKITGTKVTVDHVSVSPFTGSFTMQGLFVGNPQGWKSDKAFYLGKVHVRVSLLSLPGALLGSGHAVIKDIFIDDPEFVYETNIVNSNIKDLLKNIEKATGGDAAKPEAKPADKPVEKTDKPADKPAKQIKFEIKSFRLQHTKVSFNSLTLPMPPITMTDLGTKEGGITPDQAAGKIITNILGGIVSAVAHSAGQIGSGAADAASGAVKGIKSLFGGNK